MTCMYKVNCISKMLLTALPLPHLHDTLTLLYNLNHPLAFFYRITYRFLYVYMLSGMERIKQLETLSMVGCTDYDNSHEILGQHIVIVNKSLHRDAFIRKLVTAFGQHIRIDVTQCGTSDVLILQYALRLDQPIP